MGLIVDNMIDRINIIVVLTIENFLIKAFWLCIFLIQLSFSNINDIYVAYGAQQVQKMSNVSISSNVRREVDLSSHT